MSTSQKSIWKSNGARAILCRILSAYMCLLRTTKTKIKDKLLIKGGLLESERVDVSTVEALAKLPSRDELLGQIAYGLLSPVRMLAVALTNVAEQKETGAPAEAAE